MAARGDQPFVEEARAAGISFKNTWMRADPVIRSDTLAFWRRLKLMPSEPAAQARADEIVSAAYVGDQMVGVSTAYMTDVVRLRRRFAMWRVAVAPEYRRHHLMFALGGYSRGILEDWSREHPEQDIAGMATTSEFKELSAAKLPGVLLGSGLMMIGYTPEGGRIRVAWFDHAQV
jgi:hypothetical protein